jgi:6-phosphogluconolactonase (cycloisomerase 2 family)
MPTTQQIGLPRRSMLARVIYLVPAFVVSAMIMGTLSCRTTGSGGSSNSPTATPSVGTGALAFVTNFNDGKVSSFTRNTTTGVLKRTAQTTAGAAGAKKGPRGVVAAPSGSFLYVANMKDDNIYEFSVNPNNGVLTPLSPAFVSNGNGSGPDELAINSAGTLLWVTGAGDATVKTYAVNSSTGQLTFNSSLGGFNLPFGLALHPTLSVLYMSDRGSGLIWPMSYDSNGKLSKMTAVSSPDVGAVTPALIAIDAAGAALFTADQKTSEVSSFSINGAGALTPIIAVQNISVADAPLGVGLAVNTGAEFVFTANQSGGSVSSFTVTSVTNVITPPAVASGYNGPAGLAVDPQMANVYTADSGNGTVAQSIIKGTCGSSICTGPTVATESPANSGSGPFGITLAQ